MSRNLSLSFALTLVLPTIACLDRGSDDAQSISSDIERSNGGFDTADEAPAFGAEAELDAAAIEGDAVAADTEATDPTTTAIDQASPADGFHMLIVWGKLPADKGATEARDWSGDLKLSRGALIVRRTIAFEDRTDKLLPRAAAGTVGFQSVTRPFVDGLALTVLDPDASAGAQTLTYTPADGSTAYTLDLSQLAAGPIIVDAGNGEKIVAVGQHRRADACDRGFMRGRWHALSPHLGKYLGIITDDSGAPVGHVRGVFGQRRNGDAVLFGKLIDRDGHFRGILAGSFENGEYRARWIDRQGDHGAIHGAYFEGATPISGHFLGRWAEASCAADK
jgi:hypothetical protein